MEPLQLDRSGIYALPGQARLKRVMPVLPVKAHRGLAAQIVRDVRVQRHGEAGGQASPQLMQLERPVGAVDHAVSAFRMRRQILQERFAPRTGARRRLLRGADARVRVRLLQRGSVQRRPAQEFVRLQSAGIAARREIAIDPLHPPEDALPRREAVRVRFVRLVGIPQRHVQIQRVGCAARLGQQRLLRQAHQRVAVLRQVGQHHVLHRVRAEEHDIQEITAVLRRAPGVIDVRQRAVPQLVAADRMIRRVRPGDLPRQQQSAAARFRLAQDQTRAEEQPAHALRAHGDRVLRAFDDEPVVIRDGRVQTKRNGGACRAFVKAARRQRRRKDLSGEPFLRRVPRQNTQPCQIDRQRLCLFLIHVSASPTV